MKMDNLYSSEIGVRKIENMQWHKKFCLKKI